MNATGHTHDWHRILDSMRDAIFLIRGDSIMEWANSAAAEFLGLPRSDIVGQQCHILLQRIDLPDDACPMERLRKTKCYEEIEVYLKSKAAWFLASSAPIMDDAGDVVGAFHMLSDISERKGMEKELRESYDELESKVEERTAELERSKKALAESEKKYRTIFDLSPIAIGMVDMEGKLVALNDRVSEWLGYEMKEILGMGLLDLPYLTDESKRAALEVLKRRMQGEDVAPYNIEFISKGGNKVIGKIHANIIRDEFGEPVGDLIAIVNETKRIAAEEKLKQYSQKLEEMVDNRTRELRVAQEQLVRKEKLAVLGQLAGGVAHELRNPLGTISNAIHLLKTVPPEELDRVRNYRDVIAKSVADSERIISGLLGLSRVRAGAQAAIHVTALVSQTLGENSPPENIEVEVELQEDMPAAMIDPQQLGQVFTNLITNAYQAMPDGGKLVVTAVVEGGDVRISFRDSGYGISDEDKTKLFEPLFTTKSKGIGLGLIVSKNLVEINGGYIEFESEEGEGSTFTVVLSVSSVQS